MSEVDAHDAWERWSVKFRSEMQGVAFEAEHPECIVCNAPTIGEALLQGYPVPCCPACATEYLLTQVVEE